MSQNLALILARTTTESGKTLLALTEESPVLLIFLRHFGCTFCRQAIYDISNLRHELEARNVRPVFVHLGPPGPPGPPTNFFDYYHLGKVERISDPEATLYSTPPFALGRQSPWRQLTQPYVWFRWAFFGIKKHGIGAINEDGHQMPGVFFIKDGAIASSFRYKTIADQPPYLDLVTPKPPSSR